MKACIDPGHGGSDPGGRSLGTPEKVIALHWGLQLGKEFEARGVEVIYTRTTDTYPSLSARAKQANEAKADLFISVHANASSNSKATGPWTIYAKGSNRGEEIAKVAQQAMVDVMGGKADAVYPDQSPWVGNRRLAVLRQTDMPAILLELGFMSNETDLAEMDDPETMAAACRSLALELSLAMGVPVAPLKPVTPTMAIPGPAVDVRRIEVPTKEHVQEILRVRQLDAGDALAGLAVAEVLLRGVLAARVGGSSEVMKHAADALADFVKDR